MLNTLPLDGGAGDARRRGRSPAERSCREDTGYERAECRATIQQGRPDLADDERTVLYLPLAEERTFAQIGQELDISTGQAAPRLRPRESPGGQATARAVVRRRTRRENAAPPAPCSRR